MGAYSLVEYLEGKLGIAAGDTTPDGKFTLWEVECLAACGYAPMLQCNEDFHENLGAPQEDGTWPLVDGLLTKLGYEG
jgi:NADH-quinone oxidoreductase subunit E